MPSIELMTSFFIATAVFAYMPGPAMLYTSAQTIARGRRAGWMAVIGIHLGGYLHVVAAALGLAVLFQTAPFLFMALKGIGAAYLCWLGLKLLFAKTAAAADEAPALTKSRRRAFWDSVVVEMTNPKTAIFYLAFLPQFTDVDASLPIWAQLLVLGTIVNILFSSADVICVVLADKVSAWLKGSATANRMAERLGGTILIGLGVNLAIQK